MAGNEEETSKQKRSVSKVWLVAATGLVFVVTNVLSYFALSDFHGVGRIYDGMKRVGWPFLMFEEGGDLWRRAFYFKAALGNLVVAMCLGTVLWIAWNFATRRGWFVKKHSE
jgi:hypothetical protein